MFGLKKRREKKRAKRTAKRKALGKRITSVVGSAWNHLEEDQRKYERREAILRAKYRSNPR